MGKEITLTKDGGFYWRAWFTHWAVVAVVLLPCLILTILAVVNPFWFRESFFRFIERIVNKIANFRDRLKYRVYLGTDPEVWHALKDNNER